VRIHPLFWLVSLLLGLPRDGGAGAGGPSPALGVIIWMLALLVSILVHEMGHAFAIRYFGWQPRVVLYSLGGLALWDTSESSYSYDYNPHQDNPWTKILIAAAGPAAGFVLAALVIALCYATRHPVDFSLGGALGFGWQVEGFENFKAEMLIHYLVFINIFWGLVNLLPVFPLDGGQISRELFTLSNRYEGVARSLILSAIVGGVVAVLALVRLGFRDGFFAAVMFGYLAYISYATLQAYRGGGYGDYGQDDRGW
jgi:stage IV sporulation protein FB